MKNKLIEVLKKLAESNIDFVICGGIACILQGSDRNTYDLDLNIAFDKDNIKNAIKIFKKMKFKPRIPEPFDALADPKNREKWINTKNALVYTLVSEKGDLQIDIFLDYCIDYKELKKNADIFDIEGNNIYVSSKEDLIKAKKTVNPIRDKDIYDIKKLEELINNDNQ